MKGQMKSPDFVKNFPVKIIFRIGKKIIYVSIVMA
jgi:hypothetical protein